MYYYGQSKSFYIQLLLYLFQFTRFLKWVFKILEKGINWIADQLIRIINKIIIILEVLGFLKRIFGKLYTFIKNIFTRLMSILNYIKPSLSNHRMHWSMDL